jgi:L-rhamnose mutarotase
MMKPHYGPTNPAPEEQAISGFRRYAELVELVPDKEEVYRQMHAQVWPEVVAAIKRAHIYNYSIFLVDLAGKKYLFRYFEYRGSDPKRDFASIAEDPTVRDKWWPITDGTQVRIPGTPDGEQWLPAEPLMYLP